MFYELVQGILQGGVFFIAQAIMDNLFFAFALFAAGYFFFDRNLKSAILLVPIFTVIMFFSVDFGLILHWSIYTGFFFLLVYLGRLSALIFFNSIPSWRKRLPIIYIIVFFFAIAYVNLFLVN